MVPFDRLGYAPLKLRSASEVTTVWRYRNSIIIIIIITL